MAKHISLSCLIIDNTLNLFVFIFPFAHHFCAHLSVSQFQGNSIFPDIMYNMSVKIYNGTGQYNDLQRTDCPKKNQIHDIRYLKWLVKGDGCLSAAKITSDLNDTSPGPVTTRAASSYRQDLAFEYVIKIKKQWLK